MKDGICTTALIYRLDFHYPKITGLMETGNE
jgi:hypothetical protein